MAPSGKSKSGVDSFVSIRLFGRHPLVSGELEERLPANESPRAAHPAAQVWWLLAGAGGTVEHHREERLAILPREVRAIRRPDHAVAESVSNLEFDRNEPFAVAPV